MIRLGIIEDDSFVRSQLVGYFSNTIGFDCILEASSAELFLKKWEPKLQLDVIIVDIGLPGISGIEATKMIKQRTSKTEVVIFSVFDDNENIFKALCAGASGYISKHAPLVKIKEALETIYAGGAFMSPGIAKRITEYFHPQNMNPFMELLTARETEILYLIEEGLSNKKIAEQLHISIDTVKSHVKKIYFKLDVTNRNDIIKGRYRYSE